MQLGTDGFGVLALGTKSRMQVGARLVTGQGS